MHAAPLQNIRACISLRGKQEQLEKSQSKNLYSVLVHPNINFSEILMYDQSLWSVTAGKV